MRAFLGTRGSFINGTPVRAHNGIVERRIFAWFGHYLKGEQAPAWITNGESYLEHQRELKKLKAENGKD